jgi:hypothetical protein
VSQIDLPLHTPKPHADDAREVIYSIPAARLPSFRGLPLILRSADPAELPTLLGPEATPEILFVQLSNIGRNMAPLANWCPGLPIDLVLTDPAAEFPFLYRCTGLQERHPVRVTVPLVPGLARAVKLATSLGFAVRLAGHQPGAAVVTEIRQALDAYLHNPTVAQPVEPFHSLLLAFLHDRPLSLWSLLERDGAQIRLLDAQGEPLPDQGPAAADFAAQRLAAGAPCGQCEWLTVCGSYHRWPQADYDCEGIKGLFADLHGAASELRQGLAAHAAQRGGSVDGS